MVSIDPIDQHSAKPVKIQKLDDADDQQPQDKDNSNQQTVTTPPTDSASVPSSTLSPKNAVDAKEAATPGDPLLRLEDATGTSVPVPEPPSLSHTTLGSTLGSKDLNTDNAEPLQNDESSDLDLLQEDLQNASKQSENVVLELALDGTVRYLSYSWQDITGYPASDLINTNISQIIIGETNDREVFVKAAEAMSSDESSYRVRFLTSRRPPEAAQLFLSLDKSGSGALNQDSKESKDDDNTDAQSITSLRRRYSNYFKKQVDAVAEAAAIVLSPVVTSSDPPNFDESSEKLLLPPSDQQGFDQLSIPPLSTSWSSPNLRLTTASTFSSSSNEFKAPPLSQSRPETTTRSHSVSKLVSSEQSPHDKNAAHEEDRAEHNSESDNEAPLKATKSVETEISKENEFDVYEEGESLHENTVEIHPTLLKSSSLATISDALTQSETLPNLEHPHTFAENAIDDEDDDQEDEEMEDYVEIEAQGVLMYNKISGEPSHVSIFTFNH